MALEAKLVARLVADNSDLTRKLNQSQRKLKRFETSTAKISKAIQSQFIGMLGGAALVQGARVAIGTLADFEFQMDKVAAVSGATSDEIKALTINAKDLGARSKFTATEIGKLQEEFSRLGFAADDIINLTDATRQLATVADAELGESAKVVGNVINAFGLKTLEAGRIANVMAESFSKSALDLEKFSVAMGNVGANAKAFGLTVEETTAYLGALVDAGIDASKAGTDLRRIFIEVNKKGLTLEEAFNQIRNSTNKTTTATELFGDRAAGAGIILADNTQKVKNLTAAFQDNNREMSKMTGIMEDNLLTDLAKLRSALDGLVLNEGSRFAGFLRGSTQLLADFITFASMDRWTPQAWNELQKEIEQTTEGYKLLAQAINKGMQPGVTPAIQNGIVIPKNRPQSRTADASSQSAEGLAIGSDALRNIDIGEIDDLSKDYDKAFSTLSNGFEINAEQLEAATSKMEESLKYMGSTGPTLTEQAMQVYEPLKKFGDDLTFVASDVASGFASMIMSVSTGTQSLGEALTSGFASMMRSVGFKFIEAGALFLANSFLSQAATAGIPNPISIRNAKQAALSIGIGASLGAASGVLSKASGTVSGFGGSNSGFNGSGANVGGQSQNVNLSGQFRVRGSDLVYVLDRERNITGRTG